jgi:hypothetical protein
MTWLIEGWKLGFTALKGSFIFLNGTPVMMSQFVFVPFSLCCRLVTSEAKDQPIDGARR